MLEWYLILLIYICTPPRKYGCPYLYPPASGVTMFYLLSHFLYLYLHPPPPSMDVPLSLRARAIAVSLEPGLFAAKAGSPAGFI
jgi:hypothetical protein